MGRMFMDALDDPFPAVERELAGCGLKRDADAIIVDIHCEATSEKQGMGPFCDGRASLVVGTHTHVPTADHQILAGRHRLYLRCRHDRRLHFGHRHAQGRAVEPLPAQDSDSRFEPAMGPATLCGVAVETDDATGLARRIGAVRLGGRLEAGEAGVLGVTSSFRILSPATRI